jgi:hypothetical protein
LAQIPGIGELAERRRLLVRRSEQLRHEIADGMQQLRPLAGYAEWGYVLTRSIRTFWPVAGGLTALLFARKKSSWIGKIGKLWSWWRAGKKLADLWRAYSAKSRETPQEPDLNSPG